MKIINTGVSYMVYADDLVTYDALPAKTYAVNFQPLRGFSLEERPPLEVTERVFGVHEEKARKVLRSYADFQRSLGVILSGPKGIGKSLFARLLCQNAIADGIPVIVVDRYVSGIAQFISSIRQEVLILFDEFDKTFGKLKNGEGEDPQAGLLSLFDGTEGGKRLFVVTCNELRNLNDFLINRPGRFHYHFRFDNPSADEVRDYLNYLLDDGHKDQIERVVAFSGRIGLNYDCLRAIAFELNHGESFDTALKDLNIVNLDPERYDFTLSFEDGTILRHMNQSIDLYSGAESENVSLYTMRGEYVADVHFDPANCEYDMQKGTLFLRGEDIFIDWFAADEEEEYYKAKKPQRLTIKRNYGRMIHYAV